MSKSEMPQVMSITKTDDVFNAPFIKLLAMYGVPILFGLFSVYLGQDDNWDLRNYHLYNAYAFLNDRLLTDLAPAQMQTYFNPLIDLLYFKLTKILAPVFVGFLFGAVHGLNFVILLNIALLVIGNPGQSSAFMLSAALALIGCLGVGFISELGSTFGDNLTAILILSSVLIVLRVSLEPKPVSRKKLFFLILAGTLMGIGTGLKLTNVIYAIAANCSLIFILNTPRTKTLGVMLFGIGVLIGLGLTNGYWLWLMWKTFGNPLFPQFNSFFRSPLAADVGVVDTKFLPRSLLEILLWPFIFAKNPDRVSELWLRQVIWPVTYLMFFVYTVSVAVKKFGGRNLSGQLPNQAKFLLAFFAFSYLLWMKLFSIYRYLVPVEILAPLIMWILWKEIFRFRVPIQFLALLFICVLALNYPYRVWHHAGWADQSFSVEAPVFDDPAHTTVLLIGTSPISWLVPYFPTEVAYIGVGGNFPESSKWRAKTNALIEARGGPIYAVIDVTASASLQGLTSIEERSASSMDMGPVNQLMEKFNLSTSTSSCVKKRASIGQKMRPYLLCLTTRVQYVK